MTQPEQIMYAWAIKHLVDRCHETENLDQDEIDSIINEAKDKMVGELTPPFIVRHGNKRTSLFMWNVK